MKLEAFKPGFEIRVKKFEELKIIAFLREYLDEFKMRFE